MCVDGFGMTPDIAVAGPGDEEALVALLPEFYREEHLPWDEAVARRALRPLLADRAFGAVLLLRAAGEPAGYLVLTWGYSLEFHGRDALVDELYLRPDHRGAGWGAALLGEAERVCREEGVRALHLEVDRRNDRARRLYERLGFRDHDRYLLTRWLQG